MTDKTESRLIVVMEGGLLQGVYSTDPRLVGVRYTTVDYDTEGLGPDDPVSQVGQDDGTDSEAYVRHHTVELATIRVEAWKD